MERFNCKDGPVEMVECDDGYWVKHDDVIDSDCVIDYWATKYAHKQMDCFKLKDDIKNLKRKCRLFIVLAGLSIAMLTALIITLFVLTK